MANVMLALTKFQFKNIMLPHLTFLEGCGELLRRRRQLDP